MDEDSNHRNISIGTYPHVDNRETNKAILKVFYECLSSYSNITPYDLYDIYTKCQNDPIMRESINCSEVLYNLRIRFYLTPHSIHGGRDSILKVAAEYSLHHYTPLSLIYMSDIQFISVVPPNDLFSHVVKCIGKNYIDVKHQIISLTLKRVKAILAEGTHIDLSCCVSYISKIDSDKGSERAFTSYFDDSETQELLKYISTLSYNQEKYDILIEICHLRGLCLSKIELDVLNNKIMIIDEIPDSLHLPCAQLAARIGNISLYEALYDSHSSFISEAIESNRIEFVRWYIFKYKDQLHSDRAHEPFIKFVKSNQTEIIDLLIEEPLHIHPHKLIHDCAFTGDESDLIHCKRMEELGGRYSEEKITEILFSAIESNNMKLYKAYIDRPEIANFSLDEYRYITTPLLIRALCGCSDNPIITSSVPLHILGVKNAIIPLVYNPHPTRISMAVSSKEEYNIRMNKLHKYIMKIIPTSIELVRYLLDTPCITNSFISFITDPECLCTIMAHVKDTKELVSPKYKEILYEHLS